MTDALLPAPASICSQEVDCKWVRRSIGGSVLCIDMARDTVSVDMNIKSSRGHTSIHLTPWDSQAQYRRWNNTYRPRDKTAKQIEAFRAAERKARAILSSRHISLNRTAGRHRVRLGFLPQDYGHNDLQDDPCDNHSMNCQVPPQDLRKSEVQEDRRVAQGATSTWTSERPPSPFFSPPPPCEEAMERPNPEDDQSPQIPDEQAYDKSQSSGKEEAPQDGGPQPQEGPQYENISMDEEEDELPEDQQAAPALPVAPKEAMGIKASPAAYAPQSPKYIRDIDDEGMQDLDSDGDTEAPCLSPRKNSDSEHTQQDLNAAQALLWMRKKEVQSKALVDYSSSDSVPDLVCSDGEVCHEDPDLRELKQVELPAVRPVSFQVYPLTTTTTVVSAPPPQIINVTPRRRPALTFNPKACQRTEEIPAEEVICIDDDEEGTAPMKQSTCYVDQILMPPPMDMTLVSRKTVPLLSQDQQIQKKKGLAFRRKGRPLKLKIRQVAKMRTGPVDHEHAHLMSQLTSAVVPLRKLQISEDATVQLPPDPQQPKPTQDTPKTQ